MTVTLAPETEARLRAMAEGYGLEPAVLHKELLQQALAKAEAKLYGTPDGLDKGIEAVAVGQCIKKTNSANG